MRSLVCAWLFPFAGRCPGPGPAGGVVHGLHEARAALMLLFACLLLVAGLARAAVAVSDAGPPVAGAPGADCPSIPLSGEQPDIASLPGLCFVQDDARVLGPADLLEGRRARERRDADQLVFTHTRAAYWVYIPLRNTEAVQRSWYLQLDYPLLDEADFWVYDLGRPTQLRPQPVLLDVQRMGDGRPFLARPVHHRLFLLPLNFAPYQTLGVVLRVHSSGAINIPLSLHTAESAIEGTQDHSLAQGMFMGAMLLLALFNITLFLRLRLPQPFFNAAYIVCVGLFLTSMSGLSYQYLWPWSPWLANVSVPLTEILAILSLLLFTRHFLDIVPQQWPRQIALIRLLFGLGVVLLLASLWLPYSLMIKVDTVYAMLSMLFMFCVGVARLRQGERAARWYVASWLVFYAGYLFYGLAAFGYIPGFMAQERWMQIALGSQIFLLTYAEVMQLRDLLDKALQIESTARSSLQHEVQRRTEDLRATMQALEQANQQLRALTLHDPLTGLLNRRGLDESLEQLLRQLGRAHHALVLVVFDIDHFKRVNDQFGHDMGDMVLKWVAEVLGNLVRRKSDVLARFGGEEFVVLLPATAQADAVALIQRVLAHARHSPVVLPDGRQLSITLSAGLAAWAVGDTAQTLFKRADECLYQAKDAGRDRLVAA